MTDDDLKTSALKAFFVNWKPGKDEDAADLVAVYRMGLKNVPGWSVQRAVWAFIEGNVKDHSPAFRPKTGELAQESRNQIFLECEKQNAQIVNEQKQLKADGRTDYFRHRRNELVTAETVDPQSLPAIPAEDFPLMLEHRVDPVMQVKLAGVVPFPITKQEAV